MLAALRLTAAKVFRDFVHAAAYSGSRVVAGWHRRKRMNWRRRARIAEQKETARITAGRI